MLTRLHLEGFKSFADADLVLGPFTVLVGANASGKSNLRDAFRFLHGISRGYTLAEIIGEKWGEGGVLQWRGIRGGSREAVSPGRETFALAVHLEVDRGNAEYRIEVAPGSNGAAPRLVAESLYVNGAMVFDTHPRGEAPRQFDHTKVFARLEPVPGHADGTFMTASDRSLLPQLASDPEAGVPARDRCREVVWSLGSMRFFDLSPDAMRLPSQPGQTVLGDRGENLSAVIHAICQDGDRMTALAEWVTALTPMDARAFEFASDPTGKILLVLVEENGQRTSAHSASDGTLRFLTMLAALLGPQPSAFYFFEELDNGIHPARLHLLLGLIEQHVRRGATQIVTTTHSPELLSLLSADAREHASLTYRLPGSTETGIRRLLDIPDAERVMKSHDLWRLHAGGWFERALNLSQPDEDET